MQNTWTINQLISWGTNYLAKHQISSPRLSAELILAKNLTCTREDLYLRSEQLLTIKLLNYYKNFLLRRRGGEPLAYILGQHEFWGLMLTVTSEVLIPRPETEHLVEESLRILDTIQAPQILDLCTGNGAIALAIAHELKKKSIQSKIVASDLSPAAIKIAYLNSKRLSLTEKIYLVNGDLLAPVPAIKPFDLITANPPYVTEIEWSRLNPEIRNFEPRQALVSGPSGLEITTRIILNSEKYLRPLGWLLIELGTGQITQVIKLTHMTQKYDCIHIIKDFANIERILACRKKNI